MKTECSGDSPRDLMANMLNSGPKYSCAITFTFRLKLLGKA